MKTYKITVDIDGTRKWYNKLNQLHREDGPAIEYANGEKLWYEPNKTAFANCFSGGKG